MSLDALRAHAGDLVKLRKTLPKKARPYAVAIIEQIYRIHDAADLERVRPFMDYQQRQLEEALRGG